jgi:hypothetical protein
MILQRLLHGLAVACAAIILLAATAAAADRRALVELFTSQGCSSCPPADKVLGELARDPSLVALSLPIDYWDYLGWKDTLALPEHTRRQRGYAHARGDSMVYTPQVVVNGVRHALGSDRDAIVRAIEKSRLHPATMAVPVKLSVTAEHVIVSLPKAGLLVQGEVWLSTVKASATVKIKRGENRGRTGKYHNVVRGWHKLGLWKGEPIELHIALSELQGDFDEAAVIVQERLNNKPSRILGANLIALR